MSSPTLITWYSQQKSGWVFLEIRYGNVQNELTIFGPVSQLFQVYQFKESWLSPMTPRWVVSGWFQTYHIHKGWISNISMNSHCWMWKPWYFSPPGALIHSPFLCPTDMSRFLTEAGAEDLNPKFESLVYESHWHPLTIDINRWYIAIMNPINYNYTINYIPVTINPSRYILTNRSINMY